MVKAGLGVSVMPTWAVRPALSTGQIRAVSITPSGVHRQWSAVTLKDADEPRFLKDFLTLTRKAMSGALKKVT
jgi:DNA-binding transcriptional LysR family regulator